MTKPTLVLNDAEFSTVPDITRNGYEFTEGCGRISEELAKRLAAAAHLPVQRRSPSAFQIRFGEYKGVLVVDKRLQGQKMRVSSVDEKV